MELSRLCSLPVLTGLLCLGSYDRNKTWAEPVLSCGKNCVKKSPDKERSNYNIGLAYYKRGRYKEAIQSFRKAILLNPAIRDSCSNLGIEPQPGDSGPPVKRKPVQLSPTDVDAIKCLGLAYKDAGSYEKAIQAFREALRIKLDDVDMLHHLGQTYKAAGAYPEAIQAYREALRIKPGLAMTLNNLGLSYTETGQYGEAVETLKKAVEAKPDDAEAHNNLGVAYRKMEKYHEAIEAYQNAVRIRPTFSTPTTTLALPSLPFTGSRRR